MKHSFMINIDHFRISKVNISFLAIIPIVTYLPCHTKNILRLCAPIHNARIFTHSLAHSISHQWIEKEKWGMISQNHLRHDILRLRNANIYTSWRIIQNYQLLMPISNTTKSWYEILYFAQLHAKQSTLGTKFDIELTLLEIVWPLLHPQSGVVREIAAAHQLVSLFHCLCQ